MPVTLENLNHYALRTKRLEESIRFYQQVFGFEVVSRPPFDFPGAWLYAGGVQLHLIADGPGPDPTPEINTKDPHVAFAVGDIEEAAAAFDTIGLAYTRRWMPEWGCPQVYVQDPDGNIIEVGQYRDPRS